MQLHWRCPAASRGSSARRQRPLVWRTRIVLTPAAVHPLPIRPDNAECRVRGKAVDGAAFPIDEVRRSTAPLATLHPDHHAQAVCCPPRSAPGHRAPWLRRELCSDPAPVCPPPPLYCACSGLYKALAHVGFVKLEPFPLPVNDPSHPGFNRKFGEFGIGYSDVTWQPGALERTLVGDEKCAHPCPHPPRSGPA